MKITISENIRTMRKEHKLTQEQLAEVLAGEIIPALDVLPPTKDEIWFFYLIFAMATMGVAAVLLKKRF